MSGKIRGAQPPHSGYKTEIVRVKSTNIQSYTCISTAVFGQDIHWFGNRSHECSKAKSECNGCLRGWPVKWKGYIHCQDWQSKMALVFVEFTASAVEKLLASIPERETLRGAILQICKTKGGAKGRYVVNVLPRVVPDIELPKEEDPYPILCFLWRCKNVNYTPNQE